MSPCICCLFPPFEDARAVQLDAAVERGLPAKGEEDPVGALRLDDLLDVARRDGQEVDLVGEALARLHRRDVRVDQHRRDALLLQGFDRLDHEYVGPELQVEIQRVHRTTIPVIPSSRTLLPDRWRARPSPG